MNLQSAWSALEESYGVCDDTSVPATEKFAEENHLSAGYWSWGPAIILFPDEPISSAQWMRIFPYGIPQTINRRLASAAEGGCLIADGKGFRSTEKGKAIAHQGLQALTDKYFFAPWSCLSESELMDLSNLSSQLRDGLQNVKG